MCPANELLDILVVHKVSPVKYEYNNPQGESRSSHIVFIVPLLFFVL